MAICNERICRSAIMIVAAALSVAPHAANAAQASTSIAVSASVTGSCTASLAASLLPSQIGATMLSVGCSNPTSYDVMMGSSPEAPRRTSASAGGSGNIARSIDATRRSFTMDRGTRLAVAGSPSSPIVVTISY